MRALIFVAFSAALSACNPCDEEAGSVCLWAGQPGIAQFAAEDIDRRDSTFYLPQDVTFGSDGTAYLLDFNNHRVRAIDPEGIVTTVAGTGFLGDGPEGPARAAAFNHPTHLAFSPTDPRTLHVAAWHNSRVATIDLDSGEMAWECGTGGRQFGGDGADAHAAILDLPSGITFDDAGNLYISDQANQVVRKVDTDGIITTIAGQPRAAGYGGDGGAATEASLHASVGQAADPSSRLEHHDGALYLADTDNHVIRVIDLTSGTIDRIAGTPETPGFADGASDTALFAAPRDLAVDTDGTVFVADTDNHCIRAISPDGDVSTVFGVCGTGGYDGDGGLATEALLTRPYGVTLGPDGNLYVSDTGNHVIRVVYR